MVDNFKSCIEIFKKINSKEYVPNLIERLKELDVDNFKFNSSLENLEWGLILMAAYQENRILNKEKPSDVYNRPDYEKYRKEARKRLKTIVKNYNG